MKAVFHVDEPEKWPLTLTNAKNLADYAAARGEGYALEIVANGAAVRMLTRESAGSSGLLGLMRDLDALSVAFRACANAMRAQKIAPEALCDFVGVVDAGVAELVQKQAEGYAYLKP